MADERNTHSGPVTGPEHTPSTKELSAQIEVLKHDIADLSNTLKALGRHRRDEALGSARATAGEVRGQLDEWAEESVATVRRRPGTALGLAVIFGFILGLFGGRK